MNKLMIRTPKMYEPMREAHFLPGTGLTLIIALILYLIYFLIREVPAFIIDLIYYSGRTITNDVEAWQAIHEYITAPGTMLAALALTSIFFIITLLYVRFFEKRPLSTIGLARPAAGRLAVGYVLGLVLFAAAILPRLIYSQVEFSGFLPVAFLFLPAFIVQALSQEAFFRGYLLSSILYNKGAIIAVLISSAAFSLLHTMNQGAEVWGIAEAFVRGAMLALFTLRTGSLWGSVGINAAWSFAAGLFSPVVLNDLETSYAAFSIAGQGMPVFIAVEIAAAAVIIFAGENRLAVPLSEGRLAYKEALKAARAALKGRRGDDGVPLLERAVTISRNVEGDEAKAVALLFAVRADTGRNADELATPVSGRAAQALAALAKGSAGTASDPIAVEVSAAAARCTAELKVKHIKRAQDRNARLHCPMLRREIDDLRCLEIMRTVDEGGDGAQMMNTALCKDCTRRQQDV